MRTRETIRGRGREHTSIRLMVLVLTFAGCQEQAGTPPPPPTATAEPGTGVARVFQPSPAVRGRLRVERAETRIVPELVSAPGEVALDLKQVAKVTSRIEGQVERVFVRLGDRVTRGQPLVAIGSLHLDELVQEYLVAKAQADVAESAFRRTEKLWAERIVTEARFIADRGQFLETRVRYQHVREKLLNMGLTERELLDLERGSHEQSHRYTLRAPIAGTVVAQEVVLGEGVAPGRELFEVVDTSRVWVFANLPIEQARRFHEGDVGTIAPKGGARVTAPLSYLAPIADEKTRTVRVRFDVDNPSGSLKPQEYVDVQLSLEGPPVLAVPVSAVTQVGGAAGVFVEREAGFEFRPIETGRRSEGWVEVPRGLAPDDRVATEGVLDLKNLLLKRQIQGD